MNAAQLTVHYEVLSEQIDTILEALDKLDDEHKQTLQAHNDLRRELEKENALLKREIVEFNAAKLERKQEREDHLLIKQAVEGLKNRNDEQKRERDEKSRRIWSFGPNIAGAVVTALLSIFISVATILIVSYFSRSHL